MRKKTSSPKRGKAPSSSIEGLAIDLDCLNDMHPRLPLDMATIMATRAAPGLERNNHSSGTNMRIDVESIVLHSVLTWPNVELDALVQHDSNRITEDGAEAIALAVAHRTKDWRVVRRMQQEECADWLLEHKGNGARKLVAFEVSGVDRGSIAGRLREKVAQVKKSADVDQRWAGVVGFEKPEASLRSAEVSTHGH